MQQRGLVYFSKVPDFFPVICLERSHCKYLYHSQYGRQQKDHHGKENNVADDGRGVDDFDNSLRDANVTNVMKKLLNLDIRRRGVVVDLKVHREVHDHDNIGQEDEHGGVRPGD